MYAQVLKGNRVYELFVSASWPDFWLFLGLGLLLLLIAARLARVRIGSLPVNPLYWHYWVVAEAKSAPDLNEAGEGPRVYRLYMWFWMASLCSVAAALLVLTAILSAG